MAKPVILAVDDDPQVLRAVERDLRRHYAREYRVLRADSGPSALDTLEKVQERGDPVALMLVDQRMPRMSGVEFLEEARGMFPDVKRAYRLDGIEVERDYGELPTVTAYGSELNQVWTSLLDNAVDAVAGEEDAGRIQLRTTCENDRVLVQIEDDGPGILKELQTRIFEPFFTTKGVGEGTGLGLDVSYRIVVGRHNGDIRVVSETGDGACMEVRLPVGGPDGEPVEQPRSAERVSG